MNSSTRPSLAIKLILSLSVILGSIHASHAQTTAYAQFTDASLGGGEFEYTLTLQNTGSTNIETFWFAWVPGEDFMAVDPSSIVPPANWSDIVTHGSSSDGYAIQFTTSTAPLAPNGSLIYSFDSTVTPTEMAGDSIFYPTTPVGTSFVYSGGPFVGTSDEIVVQSAPVPEPSPLTLLVAGALGVLALGRRRTARSNC